MASKSDTPGFGGEFEILVPAYFALLLNNNPEIKNFRIRSNVSDKFGNLDDVVIDILLKNGERIHFAIQLKIHTDKFLQVDGLEADSGKFSLKKYCKSFKEIVRKYPDYHFILFTDAKFYREEKKVNEEEKKENEEGGKENEEKNKDNEEEKKEKKKGKKGKKVDKFKIDHYTSKDAQNIILNKILQDLNTSTTNNKNNIYTFEVIKENNVQNNENPSTSKGNNDQSNEETPTNGAINAQNNGATPSNGAINVQNNDATPTNGAINVQNVEETPTNGAINAQNNEATPTNAQNNEEAVTKEDFERFFSKLFLFVYQQKFRDFEQSIRKILKEETIYLKYEKLFRDWHQGNFTNKVIDKKILNSHLVNFFLSSTPRVGRVTSPPLIRSSRLLIDENTNLGLFNKIVKEFHLSIVNSSSEALRAPEANFSLQRIRHKLIDYMKEYKIDEKELKNDPHGETCLLRLAKEWKFVFGSTKDLDNETKLKILQYFFQEPVILLEFNESSKELIYLMLDLYKMENNRIKLILLGQNFDNGRFPNLRVFKNLTQLDHSSFQKIVQRCQISIQGRTITLEGLIKTHPEIKECVEARDIFQMLKGGHKVGIEEFKDLPFVTSNIESRSSGIFENIPRGAIKVVCTETGLGKSVMLQHLKNICPLLYWIKGHTFHYYKEISDVNEFLNNSLKLPGEEEKIENFYLNGNQVAIFFDELDAVSSDNLDKVFDYIKNLYSQNYIVFVATRKSLLTKIKKYFEDSVEIIDIEKLTKTKQKEYIRRNNVSWGDDLIDNFLENETVDFGIPLFLTSVNLLEQLRRREVEGRISDSVLCSIYFKVLHQHLVRKIRSEISDPDPLITDIKDYYVYAYIDILQEKYEFPALQFLFGDTIFDILKIQDKRLFQRYLSEVAKFNDPLGILNLEDNGKIVFEQPCLAEYLAGNYFANNSDKFELLINENVLGDDKKILKETYCAIHEMEKVGKGCGVALSA